MGCHTYETTNEAIDKVSGKIRELIDWAEADAEHAAENDANDTARDDRRRARNLKRALAIIENCRR